MIKFWFNFHWNLFPGVQLTINQLWFRYGLAPNRQQAIIWTNGGPVPWRIYTTLGGDELSQLKNFWGDKNWTKDIHLGLSPMLCNIAELWIQNYRRIIHIQEKYSHNLYIWLYNAILIPLVVKSEYSERIRSIPRLLIPGSLHCQCICSHAIDCYKAGWKGPCYSWVRISNTYASSVKRNDRKWKHIFMFPKLIQEDKG